MSDQITLARPYARAVFEVAKASAGDTADQSPQYEPWSQMLGLMAAVASDPDMARVLENPRLSDAQANELFNSVCEDHIDDQGRNFIHLLLEYDRLTLLPDIAALFEQYRSEAEGIIDVEVVSADTIDEQKLNTLTDALKKRLGREIKLTSRVDAALLGGAIIHAGDLVIDGSVQGRLNKLSTVLSR